MPARPTSSNRAGGGRRELREPREALERLETDRDGEVARLDRQALDDLANLNAPPSDDAAEHAAQEPNQEELLRQRQH